MWAGNLNIGSANFALSGSMKREKVGTFFFSFALTLNFYDIVAAAPNYVY